MLNEVIHTFDFGTNLKKIPVCKYKIPIFDKNNNKIKIKILKKRIFQNFKF